MGRTKRSTRNQRRFREVARIVGPGLYGLPLHLQHGLYHLKARAGLPDAELVLAYQRCRAWLARATNGIGECECRCGTKMAVNAKNAQGNSIWNLDHDDRNKLFRGILYWRCNLEIAEGDRQRKWSHATYIDAHEARVQREVSVIAWQTEFPAPGVLD